MLTIDVRIAADAPEDLPEEPPGAPPLKADLPWKTLRSVTIGLALLIIMAEISRLSGSMLDTAGQAWSFNELAGPSGPSVHAPDGEATSTLPQRSAESSWASTSPLISHLS
jgi:hypothetical protein